LTLSFIYPDKRRINTRSQHKSPSKNTISFSDSLNDLEILKLTKPGICMGNGVKDLKDIADDITDSPAKDGTTRHFSSTARFNQSIENDRRLYANQSYRSILMRLCFKTSFLLMDTPIKAASTDTPP
jgi:hypothetical protein